MDFLEDIEREPRHFSPASDALEFSPDRSWSDA
jgi:hypothetical protein